MRRFKEYCLPFWLLLNLYVIKDDELITPNFDNLLALIHVNETMETEVINYKDVCP